MVDTRGMGDKGEWETINKPETNHGQKKGTTGLDSRTSNKEQSVSEDKRFKKSLKSRKRQLAKQFKQRSGYWKSNTELEEIQQKRINYKNII